MVDKVLSIKEAEEKYKVSTYYIKRCIQDNLIKENEYRVIDKKTTIINVEALERIKSGTHKKVSFGSSEIKVVEHLKNVGYIENLRKTYNEVTNGSKINVVGFLNKLNTVFPNLDVTRDKNKISVSIYKIKPRSDLLVDDITKRLEKHDDKDVLFKMK